MRPWPAICWVGWPLLSAGRVATVREKSLENSRSKNSQGILVWVRKIGKADKSQGNIREFQNFLKTEMAMAVSLIFRNINLQNWAHSFVKWLFFLWKEVLYWKIWWLRTAVRGLGGRQKCLGMVKSQEKVREFWNRKWVATLCRAWANISCDCLGFSFVYIWASAQQNLQ